MVSEFTKRTNATEEDVIHKTESRATLAKAKGVKDEDSDDEDTQNDTSLNQALSNLPGSILQSYQSVESYMTETIDTWAFETYKLEEHPILFLSIWIFEKYDLLNTFNFDPMLFNNYMLAIEKSYHSDNAYHNMYHGADVLQAVYFLANLENISPKFSDIDLLCLFFSAAVHDVDHPGLNNNFLVTTDNPMAVLYNNRSVLENHHVSFAFRLHEEIPVWSQLSRITFKKFRDWSIDLVLSTDFSQHFGIMGEFKSKVNLGIKRVNISIFG